MIAKEVCIFESNQIIRECLKSLLESNGFNVSILSTVPSFTESLTQVVVNYCPKFYIIEITDKDPKLEIVESIEKLLIDHGFAPRIIITTNSSIVRHRYPVLRKPFSLSVLNDLLLD